MNLSLAIAAAALAGAAIAGAVFYLVFFSARKNEEAGRAQLKEDFRAFLELSEQKLENERFRQKAELEEKRASVEAAVSKLSEQLKSYEQLMRGFEADRGQKFGSLEKGLKDAAETTGRLAATTESLKALLDNSRARGQWGERMAEDILRASGLKEEVQYRRNRTQDNSASRPDFTFLLPDDHRVHMDVKFPLDNYVRMVNAQAAEEKARFKAEFLRDVKARIKEIQKRDYINPSERTLDYVILFIPNEQVYGFIHESMPGLLDESLSQKVVLCAPSTLYAVLAVIRQAFDNFHMSQATQDVLRMISHFSGVYDKFRERFEKLGHSLEDAQKLYGEITDVSFKRLDAAINKIEKVRKGEKEQEPAASESGKELV